MDDITLRLERHAANFGHTESESDEPGNLVHDLREAIGVIQNLRSNIRHSNAGEIS